MDSLCNLDVEICGGMCYNRVYRHIQGDFVDLKIIKTDYPAISREYKSGIV